MIAGLVGAGWILVAGTVVVEGESARFEIPDDWNASGEAGEYWLESGADVASLLLLPPDPDRPMEVILAEIEEQFLSTGIIEPLDSEIRRIGEDIVHVRKYRLEMATGDAILMNQYVWVASAVHVLLQVETPPDGGDEEDLFRAIHGTLEIRLAPDPFEGRPDEDPGSAREAPADPVAEAPAGSAAAPADSLRLP